MKQLGISAKKDRKVLRRVDLRAARTSVSGMLSAMVVYAMLATVGGFYADHESLALSYGLAVIAVAAYRLSLVVRFDALYGAGPMRWRRLFGLGLLMHAAVWGSLLAVQAMFYGTSTNFIITAVYIIGVSTALGSSWMAGLTVRYAYAILMCLPAAMALLYHGRDGSNLLLASMMVVYCVFLQRLYHNNYHGFWQVMSRERRPVTQAPTPRLTVSGIQLSLVYRLAHEIRTPMNSIMGMLSLLRDTSLTSEQNEYQQLASQSGKLLLTLIDDVLDYSRILSGRITLNEDFFDLRQAMEESLDAYGAVAQKKGLELSCAIDRHMPRRLRGDRDRVMQVVNNLISNAIKFSDKGEIRVQASFDVVASDAGVLRIAVADQGVGLDAQQQHDLFYDAILDDSEQSGDLFSRRSGFGLLVCRGLVEAMGGEIKVESEPGVGSIFSFSARLRMQSDMRGSDTLQEQLAGQTVIVAGASAGLLAALDEDFEALDAHTQSATDYDHALQALREARREGCAYQLLLVDTYVRKQSALNLCRTVLADPSLADVRLILLANVMERGDATLQELARRSTRIQVLVKPVHRRGLRAALLALLGLASEEPVADKRLSVQVEQALRQRYRLLLVEDNEINQIVTRGMLDKLGYQVKSVNNGQTALELLEREKFDLILMDCMMPGIDGFDTARTLRKREHDGGEQRVPIIAITANTVEGAQARCLAAGMDDYLAKPIHMDDLETVLAHWLPSDVPAPPEQGENP